jgi:hypothetical protein
MVGSEFGDMSNAGHELTGFDVEVIRELVDERYLFDCTVIQLTPDLWAIHGPIPVGGESILAEFASKELAEVALHMLWDAERRRTTEEHGH